tara:strand:+ start:21306 stop:21578 length:273 start_codon:yes stop_codon:yes gene_type:complete
MLKQNEYDFSNYCDYKLVNLFNSDCGHGGWGSQRALFLRCLFKEFKNRNIDLGKVEQIEDGYVTHSLKHPVKLVLEAGNKTLRQIKVDEA